MNGLPEDFQHRIKEILPQGPAGDFAPKAWQCFRINTLKTSVDEALSLLRGRQIDFQQVGFCPYAVLVDKSGGQELLRSEWAAQGLFYSQGLESILPVMVLDPKPGQRVLDLCAAPGSKTSQIAMHMNNQGSLQANEPVRTRMYKLKSVLQLTGAKAQVSSVDGRRFRSQTLFDRILVDAPCSCEGRFVAHDADSFAYWSVRKIKEMSHKQKGILLNASRLLAPGGVLVYATCTFAPEENEEVVDWFLRKAEGSIQLQPFSLEGITTYPALAAWHDRCYDPRIKDTVRVLPDERMEGFFIAKFLNSNYN